jgi:hypothetical protein
VNEHILAAIVADDEAEALLSVEEFDGTLGLANNLGRHAAATAAAATEAAASAAAAIATATTAAAEAIAAAVTAAAATEAITTATVTTATATAETVTTKSATAKAAVFAKAVALVPAAALPAPPSIETHAVKIFPNSPLSFHPRTPGGRARTLRRSKSCQAKLGLYRSLVQIASAFAALHKRNDRRH